MEDSRLNDFCPKPNEETQVCLFYLVDSAFLSISKFTVFANALVASFLTVMEVLWRYLFVWLRCLSLVFEHS
jgi:hypothetical protein